MRPTQRDADANPHAEVSANTKVSSYSATAPVGLSIVTVVGKAFFDVGHAPADHSNRRTDLQGYAAWEIHRVMKLTAQS